MKDGFDKRNSIDFHIEYNIGDVVTISKEPHLQCPAGWVHTMDKYLGQEVVILCKTEKIRYSYSKTQTYSSYRIGRDPFHPLPFIWTSGCFEYECPDETLRIEPPSTGDILRFIDVTG